MPAFEQHSVIDFAADEGGFFVYICLTFCEFSNIIYIIHSANHL